MNTLYLIRHAHAVDSSDDASRVLSDRGRRQLDKIGSLLRGKPIPDPTEIWHSPLVRARETAQILAESLGWRVPFVEIAGLEPEADPRALLARIDDSERRVAIFGHEPFLGLLAAILVTGAPWPPVVVMHKASVLALDRMALGTRSPWVINWQLSPELVGEPLA